MAPLAQALQVAFESKTDDGAFCYRCELDPTWAVGAIPQGGYALGVVVEACVQYQCGSSHPDPVHATAHFLHATTSAPGHVRVKVLKSGKTFTNILADLVQQGTTKITAHLIFGDLSPSQLGQARALAPPSPYARRLPLYSHPGTMTAVKTPWRSKMETQMSVDPILLSRNDPTSPTRMTAQSVGGGGVEWGAWLELTHKDDKLTTSSVPFFCDAFVNLPNLLPESEPGSAKGKGFWHPTITMTVEFKARVPTSRSHSARTVALYCESRFQNDPEGRHNGRVEVWTAPSEIGRGDITESWRENQYCIAVADQMALMLPFEMNIRQGTKGSTRL